MIRITMSVKMFDKIMTGEHSEEKKWTDKDLHEFAEWCSKNDWYYDPDEKVWNCKLWGKIYTHTSSQLLEIWEVETGRREK